MITRVHAARSIIGISALVAGTFLGVGPVHAAGLPAGCSGEVSDGNNTITCTKDLEKGAVIDAGSGDDTIVIKADVLAGAVVRGGAGKDKISAYNVGRFLCPAKKAGIGAGTRNGGTLDGGAGDDAITVGGQDRPKECDMVLLNKGPGGNVGRHGAVVGGAGNDVISVGSNGYVYQEDLADTMTASIAHGGRIAGDAGEDTITIGIASLGQSPPSDKYPDATDAVFGGAGNDKIFVIKIVGAADIYGDAYAPIADAGNDSITVGEMIGGWVHGGPGADSILGGQLGGAAARLWGDEGNDTIKATELGITGGIFGGDGNDTLAAESVNNDGKTHNGYVIGGNGDDKIDVGVLGADSSVIRGDGLEGSTDPDVGTGKDTITVGTNNGFVFGGNDDDLIKIETDNYYVDGGAGADICTFANQGPKAKTMNCERK